jgi:hypothetical protein
MDRITNLTIISETGRQTLCRKCDQALSSPRPELLRALKALRVGHELKALEILGAMLGDAECVLDPGQVWRLRSCAEYYVERASSPDAYVRRVVDETVRTAGGRLTSCGVPWHPVEADARARSFFAPFFIWASDQIRRCEGRVCLQVRIRPSAEAEATYNNLSAIVRAKLPIWGTGISAVLVVARPGFGEEISPIKSFRYFQSPLEEAFLGDGTRWADSAVIELMGSSRPRRARHGPIRLPQTAHEFNEILAQVRPGLVGDERHAAVRKASAAYAAIAAYFALDPTSGHHDGLGLRPRGRSPPGHSCSRRRSRRVSPRTKFWTHRANRCRWRATSGAGRRGRLTSPGF